MAEPFCQPRRTSLGTLGVAVCALAEVAEPHSRVLAEAARVAAMEGGSCHEIDRLQGSAMAPA